MKVLITGGSGTVGKYFVDELLSHHYDVGVLDVVPPKQNVRFHKVDMLLLNDVEHAVKGYDAVIHAAGIPHPLDDSAERVFHLNVNGTFNVLEASARNGIKKVVFTSSESTLGFAFMTNRMVPEYIPIDEQHPTRPQDPYGLSKVIGEQICKTYSAKYNMRTICLREPWIWVPEATMIPFYKTLVTDYDQWYKNLWTYVHVFDVAQAHRLALEKDLSALHELFFITAQYNWTGKDSRALLAKHFPDVKKISQKFSGAEPLISHEKATAMLGYHPNYSVKDLFAL
ncbi:MAG: NAD(P)-dependent oxidoreductase [Bacteroidota bacterium]|nr:NAD(P)-dependent oxidoreductase [Bacteroidota bacterium]